MPERFFKKYRCHFWPATLLLLAACNGGNDHPAPAAAADTLVAPAHDAVPVPEQSVQLTQLFSVIKGLDAGFDPKNFPAYAEEGTLPADTVRFDRADFRRWQPWLVYNADSSRAIDLVSYNYSMDTLANGRVQLEGNDPDFEIAVLDYRGGTRLPLVFAGPGALDLDAVWQDQQTVVLALAELEPGEEKSYRYRLTLHKYDLAARRSWTSRYPAVLRGNPADLMQKDVER